MNIRNFRLPEHFVSFIIAFVMALLVSLTWASLAFAAPTAPQYLNQAETWLAKDVNSSRNMWLTTATDQSFIIGTSFHTNVNTGIRIVIPVGKTYTATQSLSFFASSITNAEAHYEGSNVVVTGQTDGYGTVAITFTAQLSGMLPITLQVLESTGGGFVSAPMTLSIVDNPGAVTFSAWYGWQQFSNYTDLLMATRFPITTRVESGLTTVETNTLTNASRTYMVYNAYYGSYWDPRGSDEDPQAASAWKFDNQCVGGDFGIVKSDDHVWITVFNGPDYTSNVEVVDNHNQKTTMLFNPGETRSFEAPLEGIVNLKVGTNLCGGLRWNQDSAYDIGIAAPLTAPYGGWPISPRFIVTNTLNYDRLVTVTTWVGGLAWGGIVGDYLFPAENGYGWNIYDSYANSDGVTLWWHGWIGANKAITLGFSTNTQSWVNSWTVEFLHLTVDEKTVSQNLTLTEGPQLGGSISMLPASPFGQGYWMYITTTARYAGQFVMTNMTSDCAIAGLPSGFVGNYARTFEVHGYYVQYQSGGPTCILTATIQHLEAGTSPIPTFTITGTLVIPHVTVNVNYTPAGRYLSLDLPLSADTQSLTSLVWHFQDGRTETRTVQWHEFELERWQLLLDVPAGVASASFDSVTAISWTVPSTHFWQANGDTLAYIGKDTFIPLVVR